jgi:hypothetical protein
MNLNLFELAEKQLIDEVEERKRDKYTERDIINYAIKIRRYLDKQGGNIEGILNNLMCSKQEIRQKKYLRTGK